MKIYYLAHPIAPDENYTVDQNLAHLLKMQRILWEAAIWTIIPYYTYVVEHGSGHDKPNLEEFLRFDCEVVTRCNGIILAGHKVSNGMKRELDAVTDGTVHSFVGVRDADLTGMIRQHAL